MKRGGLRMALEKVKRRGLYHLPHVNIVVLFSFFLIVIFLLWSKCISNKIKN